MNCEILEREKHSDDNGWLSELVSMDHQDVPFEGVHSYVVSFDQNTTRANHYHENKDEWLTLVSGRVKIALESVDEEKRDSIILDEEDDQLRLIHLHPKVAHGIKNIGDKKACVIVFSKTPEVPEDTIEYDVEVKS